ncbi:hypothetical protein LCGC14_2707980 [marine sediment metagenome]|uniref:DUF1540 domain-containing protein n=1 Tax=marine sediment metagenome TaxID=412755 RepID=A0A0F8ZDR9_9ZZZZ
MEMPQILECDANECAYNQENKCHAMAITIGGETDHKCDTFLQSSKKGGVPGRIGAVGACKCGSCTYNADFECSAPGIRVGHEADMLDCLTFAPV